MASRDQRQGGKGAGGAAPALLQQAVAHYQAKRHRQALDTCRRVLRREPNRPDVLSFAGMVALELGDVEEAVGLYRAAIEQKPDFTEAHYNLGNALMKLGRIEEAVPAYRRAAELRPEVVAIHNNLGNALQSLDRFAEAAAAYQRAVALAPTAAELHRNLGIVLDRDGRRDEAIAAFRRAVRMRPDWAAAQQNLANALMEKGGEPQGVLERSEAWLKLEPSNIEAISLQALARRELGDAAGARRLIDFDRFVQLIEFTTPPEGYASMAEFNAALSRHALAHPTLKVPPQSDVRYHCPTLRITEEFLAEPKGPAAQFERMIETAVAGYMQTIARQDAAHPFLAKPPQRWTYTSWAAVLDGQGNLNPHVHFDGYVSGVYYAQIPGPIGAAGQGQAGWFELGGHPARFPCTAKPETRAIQPREGLMLLFPSYFYHRTIPFSAPEPRISIAFDAIPAT